MLERDGLSVGVVTGTAGVERPPSGSAARRCRAAASRWTPGRDALVAGARLVLAVREAARDERSRATVGAIAVRPAIPTAVPGVCELDDRPAPSRPRRARRDGQRGPRRRGPHRRRRAGRDRLRADLGHRAGRLRRGRWSRSPRRPARRGHRRQRAALQRRAARRGGGRAARASRPSCCSSRAATASATRPRRTPRPRTSRPACGPSRACADRVIARAARPPGSAPARRAACRRRRPAAAGGRTGSPGRRSQPSRAQRRAAGRGPRCPRRPREPERLREETIAPAIDAPWWSSPSAAMKLRSIFSMSTGKRCRWASDE